MNDMQTKESQLKQGMSVRMQNDMSEDLPSGFL